jgi:hypothetical protein
MVSYSDMAADRQSAQQQQLNNTLTGDGEGGTTVTSQPTATGTPASENTYVFYSLLILLCDTLFILVIDLTLM